MTDQRLMDSGSFEASMERRDKAGRRTSRRFSQRGLGTLVVNGHADVPVLLVNRSIGGAAVVAVNCNLIQPGMLILFKSGLREYESRVASVRHIAIEGGSVCRIGLEWSPALG